MAVIDNGFWISHDDLDDNIYPGYNVINNNTTVTPDPSDPYNYNYDLATGLSGNFQGYNEYDETHGTSVAGIIAAEDQGLGGAGVAPDVKIMPIKAGYGYSKDVYLGNVISAFNYISSRVSNGVNIRAINASFLFNPDDVTGRIVSGPNNLQSAISVLEGQGVFVVCAAGNEGINVDGGSDLQGNSLSRYPVDFTNNNIIGVGMTNENQAGVINSKSNYGATSVDLFAPGAQSNGGAGIWSTRFRSHPHTAPIYPPDADYGEDVYKPLEPDDSYVPARTTMDDRGISGTSFATPMVTGTIALLLSLNPEASLAQIRTALFQVDPYSTLTSNSVTGGELDAKKAVSYAATNFAIFSATVIGDTSGNATADTFSVQVKPYDNTKVQVFLNNSVTAVAEVSNSPTAPQLAIFGLGGNDTVNVGTGVNLKLYVSGGQGNDVLHGGDVNDNLLGGDGTDTIFGGLGNDYLDGGFGNDALIGEAGNDVLTGGNGTDTADYTSAPASVIVTLDDVQNDSDGSGGNDNVSTTVERLLGSPFNDGFGGSANADYFDGGLGNDSLTGNGGNDTLIGQRGVDSLNGGDGNDTMYTNEVAPGVRDQTVKGGLGSDVLYYDSADATSPHVWDSAVESAILS